MKKILILLTMVMLLALAACAPVATENENQPLKVIATTSLVADVVGIVAGDRVEITVLLPVGTDPHDFTPRPQDVAAVANADLIFANGVGLEAFLPALIESSATKAALIEVSEGVLLLESKGHKHAEEGHKHAEEGHKHAEEGHKHAEEGDKHAEEGDKHAEEGDKHAEEGHKHAEEGDKHAEEGDKHAEEGDKHADYDPHVWMDPNNVIIWTQNIVRALSQADAANAAHYTLNGEEYIAALLALDIWITEQVELIDHKNRKLVSDHFSFGYFAHRYKFEQVGALIPSFSTAAKPTAQEIAALQDAVIAQNVPAIFVDVSFNPSLAEQVAADTGVKLVRLYTASLSDADGPAATYIDFITHNVTEIINALK